MPGILEGIRVIEWTMWHAGPYAGSVLADLGAEVIKVEHPATGDAFRGTESLFGVPMNLPEGIHWEYEELNRNKKGITLDLRNPKGQDIMHRLLDRSDVFLTNLRGADKMGLNYDNLSQRNPRLIYAQATGFGTKGPDTNLPSLELMGYARSGIMFGGGEEGMPPVFPGLGISDRILGVYLAMGVLAALLGRERLGIGQKIATSQLGSIISLLGITILPGIFFGVDFDRQIRVKSKEPLYNWYRCKDDNWIAFACFPSEKYWSRFCAAIAAWELDKDPRFLSHRERTKNAEELVAILDRIVAAKTYGEWEERFRAAGDLSFSKINRPIDVCTDPQVLANDYVTEWDHPVLGKTKFVGFPIEYSKTPTQFRSAAPQFGEHTEETLINLLGFTWEEIASLREEKVL